MPTHRDLSSPVPWRRSLRAAQSRRAKQARRRRIAFRGRSGALLAVALSTVAAGGALAQDATPASTTSAASASDTLRAVQQKLGLTADGINGPRTRAAVRRFQRRSGLTVDGVIGPKTLAALGLTSTSTPDTATDAEASPSSASSSDAQTVLAKIAQCESGGDPTAISADGKYRGKYQFDRATWQQIGGSGDPAQASESEQDQRALTLYQQRGTAPWPNCGPAAKS